MRRVFFASVLLATLLGVNSVHARPGEPIRVLVWDEQQPQQKNPYCNFLGNEIAEQLRGLKGLKVVSARQNDPKQGLGDEALDRCDVLMGARQPGGGRCEVVRSNVLVAYSPVWTNFCLRRHQ